MSGRADPPVDPVDDAGASTHWWEPTSVGSLGPVRGDAPPVAHAWFQPLTKKIAGDAHLLGWRFRCPFCGDEREADHYSECYSHAYRHMSSCEWTDPLGMGPGTPF